MKKGNQFIVRLLIVFAIAFGAQATASAQLGGLNVKNLKNKAKKAVDDKVYKEVNGAKGTAKFEVQKAVNEAEHDLKNKANAAVKGSEEEQTEKGAKMLQVMDWAFAKANGNIPGFGTSQEMAQKYLDKYGSYFKPNKEK